MEHRNDKTAIWTESELNERLDQLEKTKVKNDKKVDKIKYQLMWSHVNNNRRDQLERYGQLPSQYILIILLLLDCANGRSRSTMRRRDSRRLGSPWKTRRTWRVLPVT